MINNDINEYVKSLPPVIGINDVMKILNIGRNTAYTLSKAKDFPILPIKKPIRIPRDEFLKWAKIIRIKGSG